MMKTSPIVQTRHIARRLKREAFMQRKNKEYSGSIDIAELLKGKDLPYINSKGTVVIDYSNENHKQIAKEWLED
ncbi:hypothetical protein A374_17054 [Fictibacillus macauensis ZFHKF-1]|uniref:Uncharacterized protein n=1 Tax=Fictibacillus macauensis ZFHKF-1 TaxID=1196324 RepID=I8IXA4_9BACL|nr:hypothetical protein [Fictibacillus macauensis]EIT84111.1 hypothetical protein A374_17054 [Fictibacillus macauensis ZFHKF-1]